MVEETLFWQVMCFTLLGAYLGYVGIDIIHMRRLHILRKNGHMTTKKGTYTFTPKEKKE